MTDQALSDRRRGAAAAFIFVTVTLDIVAGAVIGPVWPALVQGFLKGDTSRSAMVFGAFATIFAVMQLFFAPVLGALSDRFGRRPVILISCFGLGIDYVIMAVAPSLWWLFVGRTLAGITSASMAAANAYIADVTPPEKRAAAFGMLSAAFGVGFIVGPLLGGVLGQFSPRLPFWVSAALTFANAAYGLFLLPESLPKSLRRPFSLKLANPLAALGVLSANAQLLGLAGVTFVGRLIFAVYAVVWSLYGAARYGWGPSMIGVSMGVVGVSSLLVSTLLVRPAVAALGERTALLAGQACAVVGFALMGWAGQSWMFMASIVVLCLSGVSGPCIQSLMTRQVSASEQGQLQGANAGVTSIAGLIGPSLFASALAFGTAPGRAAAGLIGLPFYLAAALMLVAMGLAWRATAAATRAEATLPAA